VCMLPNSATRPRPRPGSVHSSPGVRSTNSAVATITGPQSAMPDDELPLFGVLGTLSASSSAPSPASHLLPGRRRRAGTARERRRVRLERARWPVGPERGQGMSSLCVPSRTARARKSKRIIKAEQSRPPRRSDRSARPATPPRQKMTTKQTRDAPVDRGSPLRVKFRS
jgi:hypothetical protein